jgi:hypothetical protein
MWKDDQVTEQGKAVLVKDRIWPALNYEPHVGQRKIHNDPARHRVASCGRRFGKSVIGGHEITPLALYAYTIRNELMENSQQMRLWIVGPNYDDAEREFRVFYDDCRRLKLPMQKPGSYYDPRGGNMMVTLWDSRFILETRSADHPDSLDGEGLNFVLMVEAAKMKASIWNKYIRPALADKRGQSIHTSTPEGRNHFYELWKRGQDPDDSEWASWRMPSWINDTIFPGGRQDPEILDMERDMSPERFNQEIGAEFTEFVGRVFKDFDEEMHVKTLDYDPRYPVYICTDYGFTNPFVCLVIQVDVWDNVYVLAEYRTSHTDINDIARDLTRWKDGICTKAVAMYPEPASPGDTRILEKHLRVRSKGNTGGRIKERLELIRQHLKPVPEHVPWEKRVPKLLIDRSCGDLIEEMGDKYRYPDNKSEIRENREEPLKKDDHGPEALGRFFRGYYGAPGSSGRARVSKAKVRG